jgi:hypothetical protein
MIKMKRKLYWLRPDFAFAVGLHPWGADWGEDGYMWIKYGCAGIGSSATWIRID